MGDCRPGETAPQSDDFDPYMFVDELVPAIPEAVPVWEIALKLTFYVVIFLIDIIGNTIVVLIIVLIKRMRTPTNILILNLAISDLMVGMFCMWVHAGNQITTVWPFGQYVCKVNTFIQGRYQVLISIFSFQFSQCVLGPVVQSVVNLTSSLRVISLTVLADSIYNILIFFAEKM